MKLSNEHIEIKFPTSLTLFFNLGRHTPEHAKVVAVANILPRIQQIFINPTSSDDLKLKVCRFP